MIIIFMESNFNKIFSKQMNSKIMLRFFHFHFQIQSTKTIENILTFRNTKSESIEMKNLTMKILLDDLDHLLINDDDNCSDLKLSSLVIQFITH